MRKEQNTKRQETHAREQKQLLAAKYFVKLIRAVLEEKEPEPKPESLTMNQIFQTAKKHNLECLVYHAAVKIVDAGDDSVMQNWNRTRQIYTAQNSMQQKEIVNLCRMLPEDGIRVLPLKGCIMKQIYPKAEYRQMLDIDLLIDESNRKKVCEILKKSGYTFEGSDSDDTVDHYIKKPWINLEIHTQMIPFQYENSRRYQDIWERCEEQNQIYRMNWDDYYVFLIEHFAKHFYYSGCGIRFLLDVYIFLEKKGKFLNQKYLKKEFEKRNLESFRRKMEHFSYRWFGDTGEIGNSEEERAIMLSSTFGNKEQYCRNMKKKVQEESKASWLVPFIYIKRRVFLGYHEMCGGYPILKKCPLLLPVTWGIRVAKGIYGKRKQIIVELKRLKKR